MLDIGGLTNFQGTQQTFQQALKLGLTTGGEQGHRICHPETPVRALANAVQLGDELSRRPSAWKGQRSFFVQSRMSFH